MEIGPRENTRENSSTMDDYRIAGNYLQKVVYVLKKKGISIISANEYYLHSPLPLFTHVHTLNALRHLLQY